MKEVCFHGVAIVEEFNDLGVATSCLFCGDAIQLEQELVERFWTPLHHNSPKGREKDFTMLVRNSVFPKGVL